MASNALLLLWSIIASLFFSLLPATSSLNDASDTTKFRREVIVKRHGAVATDDGRCSRIGMDVLREGGHSIDAAVAAALCLGVVSPASSGIGGGAFMLIRLANGKAQAIDMREIAPMRASQNMYAGNATLKATGALSVAVPGELAGLHKAWKEHGKLPWERLVRPAEKLARMGFKISPYLHMQMVKTKSGILADKGLRDVFTSNGNLLQPGDICINKKLAETLRRISKHGLKAFYNGSIGFNLVRDVQKAGGILTIKDLQRYEVKMREPISANILGLKAIGMPPPSSGGASMILMLNILSQYGLPAGISGPLGIHREIEALKHVFAVRMNLGDPDFVNVSKVLSDMLSPKFAEELKKTIDDNMTFGPRYYGGRWNQIQDHGTSHMSIVDRERNAVSMTSTVNSYFGAQMLSPNTGIVLNNEMDNFFIPENGAEDLPPAAPSNFIRPGKRPLSSMSPTILLKNDKLKAVMGASGGAMIIAATTEVFLNHFARGMDPLSSVMAPRVYHELIPNIVYYENWTTVTGDHIEVPADIRASLIKKGHVLQSLAGGTVCQFIVLQVEGIEENRGVGELVTVSDSRKGVYDNMTFDPDYYGGRWNQVHDHGTSHLSIVDSERNALAFTTSVNDYCGAQLLSPSTGVILHNQMDDFSMPMNSSDAEYIPPAPANFIRPGKRPLSSMTTTILLKDDKLKAVTSARGGSLIIGGTTEVFLNHFVRGMDPFSSVMAPRIYHELTPNIVTYENGSNCQFIVEENGGLGELTAVSDVRKGGFPAGY